jgi:hypothetical protein
MDYAGDKRGGQKDYLAIDTRGRCSLDVPNAHTLFIGVRNACEGRCSCVWVALLVVQHVVLLLA